nr:RNA-directed DNA polymerase, eukaryota [Tanacetum cinerariifolium]
MLLVLPFHGNHGTWITSSTKLLIISVYASHDLTERRMLWDFICHLIDFWDGECILLDNQKLNENKRNIQNHLIELDKILDQGRGNDDIIQERSNFLKELQDINNASTIDMVQKAKIRWAIEGNENSNFFYETINHKHSQLAIRRVLVDGDRIVNPSMVKNEFLKYFANRFAAPITSSITFDSQFPNRLSPDQNADLKRNVSYDEIISTVWDCGTNKFPGPDGFTFEFYRKYQNLIDHDVVAAVTSFFSTGTWITSSTKLLIISVYAPHDLIERRMLYQGRCNDDMIQERSNFLKELQDINNASTIDMVQKAKIRWAIEGNENSKFFHGIINKKHSQLAIRRVLVDGDRIVNPSMVKNEFLKHFANRFAAPITSSITFDSQFPNRLSLDQNADLKRNVSYDEIISTVWDCGTNKFPGPDGFTFEFYRKYQNLIDHDVVAVVTSFFSTAAVTSFFSTGTFPPGCKSSFIALIPKSQEAKMVKYFRPIRLVGSMYKIITKILANRLNLITSELDYLDVVLNYFGFGPKWRCWIQGCLNSAMGSILVNGSLTLEFKFSKGLKQGDPLSPFLFILIMESLHLSFNNVVNVGLYNASKKNGGLGVSSFFAFNCALLFKWISRFIANGSSLWSSFITAIYGVRGALDNPPFYSRRSPSLDIVNEVRKLFNKGLLIVRLDSSSVFSVKSAREFIDDSFLSKADVLTRWDEFIPIKINIFVWRVSLDKLPTRLNLSLRSLDIPSIIFPLCSIDVESTLNLIFSC